jgi:micrococcal nuclease
MARVTRPRRRLAAVTACACALLTAACAGDTGGDEGIPDALLTTVADDRSLVVTGRVDRVVDGDTLVVRLGPDRVRVRLLGIDTPESVTPDRPVECFGPEAAERARELLPEGGGVVLETDPGGERQDDFGRLLAYVTPEGGDRSVQVTLLREGYADLYVFRREDPFARVRQFRQARDAARREARGLWGACRPGR